MSGEQVRSWGVTPPLSTALPTERELQLRTTLLEELRRQGSFASQADTNKRFQVLESLQKMADEFVKRVAKEKEPKNELLQKNARGKIFPYGSFRLGVYNPDSDIDTLIVGPKYVTRQDYFHHFPDLLVTMAPEGAITDLTAVEESFVPIIKFKYSGISIDLIFSRIVVLREIPAQKNFDLMDTNLLRGLDDMERRSINGPRVSQELLDLVPEHSTFRDALRAIKLWSQRRALTGNIVGFFGGIVWALIVARTCQLYPKATSSSIVHKFFFLLLRWPWKSPIYLKHIEQGFLDPVKVWDPQRDGKHNLMPVITPAYPSMCTTYGVTYSTKAIILKEVERGFNITTSIMDEKKPWSVLFERHTFFTQDYKYYIAVISSGLTKQSHLLWSGFVESKIRGFTAKLESQPSIELAHPYVKGFFRKHRCSPSQIPEVQEGSLAYMVRTTVSTDTDVANEDKDGKSNSDAGVEVFTTTNYIGIAHDKDATHLDLSYNVEKFKQVVLDWAKYDSELNHVQVSYVKRFDLPDDLFVPGEKKPQRKVATMAGKTAKLKKRANTSEVVHKLCFRTSMNPDKFSCFLAAILQADESTGVSKPTPCKTAANFACCSRLRSRDKDAIADSSSYDNPTREASRSRSTHSLDEPRMTIRNKGKAVQTSGCGKKPSPTVTYHYQVEKLCSIFGGWELIAREKRITIWAHF